MVGERKLLKGCWLGRGVVFLGGAFSVFFAGQRGFRHRRKCYLIAYSGLGVSPRSGCASMTSVRDVTCHVRIECECSVNLGAVLSHSPDGVFPQIYHLVAEGVPCVFVYGV